MTLARLRILLTIGLFLSACHHALPEQSGWAGTIELANGTIHLPFRMFLDLHSTSPAGYFLIGNEKAPIPEITRQGDSITLAFSEYGAEMRAAWNGAQLN